MFHGVNCVQKYICMHVSDSGQVIARSKETFGEMFQISVHKKSFCVRKRRERVWLCRAHEYSCSEPMCRYIVSTIICFIGRSSETNFSQTCVLLGTDKVIACMGRVTSRTIRIFP